MFRLPHPELVEGWEQYLEQSGPPYTRKAQMVPAGETLASAIAAVTGNTVPRPQLTRPIGR